MTCEPRTLIGIVIGERHPVQRDNLQWLPIDLQVCGQIGRSIHNSPGLPFASSERNLWAHRAIHREDALRLFRR